MNKGHTLEKILRVYDDSGGVYIEVRLNPEYDSGLVIATNTTQENIDWFGDNYICINSKQQAMLLARAIAEVAETLKENDQ
jgi:hypothetical protein